MKAGPPEWDEPDEEVEAQFEADQRVPPDPERLTEHDLTPLDWDPRESLDDPPPPHGWADAEMEE